MKKWVQPLLFLLFPFLTILIVELPIRLSVIEVVNWGLEKPLYIVATYLIIFLVQSLLFALINNYYLSLIINQIVFGLVAVANYYKMMFLNDPILPWDLVFVKQIFDLLPNLKGVIPLNLILFTGVIILLVIAVVIKYTKFNVLSLRRRVSVFVITFGMLIIIVSYPSNFFSKIMAELELSDVAWDYKISLDHNGLVLNFVSKINELSIPTPENYSKKEVSDIVDSIEVRETVESDIQPNIVVIMSEAFWEFEKILPNYDGESYYPTVTKYKVGNIVSPTYGGGTSNVEFEALTGYSNSLLPDGSVPYQQYMSTYVPALPNLLKEYGYETSAFHTYHKYFWNRMVAYPALGFDQFIGLEDLESPNYYGAFIDDRVVNDMILNQLTEGEQPQFVFAVTMQNHGMYVDGRYGSDTMQLATEYSENTNNMINTYGTGVVHSDKVLKDLLEELETLDEPTLVVFFGDHLPYLENAYNEAGFVDKDGNYDLEDQLKLKETPIAVWNNYDKDINEVGSFSTSFLAPYIVEWAELKMPTYYSFLQNFRENMPGYTSIVKSDANGELYSQTPEQMLELEQQYRILQYDLLHGNRYLEELEGKSK